MPKITSHQNKMPDISGLMTAVGCYLASSLAGSFQSRGYDKNKNTFITRFVTLIDKAKYEYSMAREAVSEEIKEKSMTYDEIIKRGDGQYLYITKITNHLENCIITLGILFKLLKKLDKSTYEELNTKNITDIRNSIIHIEDRITQGINGGIILKINEEGTLISLLDHELFISDLAEIIKKLNFYIRNLL